MVSIAFLIYICSNAIHIFFAWIALFARLCVRCCVGYFPLYTRALHGCTGNTHSRTRARARTCTRTRACTRARTRRSTGQVKMFSLSLDSLRPSSKIDDQIIPTIL